MRINCGIGAARLAVAAVLAIAAAAPRAMQDSIQLQTVELNYRDRCARCHGDALQGGRASSLIDTVWAWGGDDASIARSIRTGHASAGMPQVADGLSDGEVRALVILIRERAAARAPRWWTPEDDRRIFESERHPFKLETVVDGLHEPWSFALLSDGRKLITEKSGRLRIVEGGRLLPDPIAGTPSAWSKGQGGLLDVVAHPKFAENGWIYITYSDPGPGELAMTAVARGRIVENTWVQQQRLFNLPKDVYRHSSIHFGSRIAFDRTGLLYFSVGDRGFGEDAQDLTRPNGKIHRIAEDGTLPADNPIVGVVDGLRTIWTFGNRNPQGLAFHPVTGDLWEVEQGPRGGDELNRLVGGHNYGWPLVSLVLFV